MIFSTRCAGCDTPGAPLCPTCRFALLGPAPHVAAVHDRRGGGAGGGGVEVAPIIAAVPFSGRARDVVLGLKYRNRRAVAQHLAGVLVNRLLASGAHVGIELVTWAPTGAARRRRRGFDQGEVVARTVARQLGLPCRALLRRDAAAGAQTGRSRADRLDGPRFTARPGLGHARILVVDDVVTTGSTLRAAEQALVRAGAAAVVLAAVAATPAARPMSRAGRIGAPIVPIRAHGSAAEGHRAGGPNRSRRGAPAAA